MIFFLFIHYLRLYLRSAALMFGVIGFSLLLVVVASLAFRTVGMSAQFQLDVTPGMLWLVILFSLTMLLHFCAELDNKNGLLAGFAASPVSSGEFFIAKLGATLCLVAGINALIFIAHQIFFGVNLGAVFLPLFIVSILFSLGYLSVGILLSHLSVRVAGREVLFPLIAFPLAIPAAVAAITLTRTAISTGNIAWDSVWVAVLLCFAAVSCSVSWLLFDEAIQG